MKKLITLLGSVLLFTGLKAQKETIIKKETTAVVKLPAGTIEKSNTGDIKEKAVAPVSGIIIPETDKPVNGIIIPETDKPVNGIIIPETDKPFKSDPIPMPMKQ